jgi:hypothetical protein
MNDSVNLDNGILRPDFCIDLRSSQIGDQETAQTTKLRIRTVEDTRWTKEMTFVQNYCYFRFFLANTDFHHHVERGGGKRYGCCCCSFNSVMNFSQFFVMFL